MPAGQRTERNRSVAALNSRSSDQAQITDFSGPLLERPKTDSEVIATVVIPNTFWHWEGILCLVSIVSLSRLEKGTYLRPDVRHPFTELISVDEDHASNGSLVRPVDEVGAVAELDR